MEMCNTNCVQCAHALCAHTIDTRTGLAQLRLFGPSVGRAGGEEPLHGADGVGGLNTALLAQAVLFDTAFTGALRRAAHAVLFVGCGTLHTIQRLALSVGITGIQIGTYRVVDVAITVVVQTVTADFGVLVTKHLGVVTRVIFADACGLDGVLADALGLTVSTERIDDILVNESIAVIVDAVTRGLIAPFVSEAFYQRVVTQPSSLFSVFYASAWSSTLFVFE